jgi:hypothetical protein
VTGITALIHLSAQFIESGICLFWTGSPQPQAIVEFIMHMGRQARAILMAIVLVSGCGQVAGKSRTFQSGAATSWAASQQSPKPESYRLPSPAASSEQPVSSEEAIGLFPDYTAKQTRRTTIPDPTFQATMPETQRYRAILSCKETCQENQISCRQGTGDPDGLMCKKFRDAELNASRSRQEDNFTGHKDCSSGIEARRQYCIQAQTDCYHACEQRGSTSGSLN